MCTTAPGSLNTFTWDVLIDLKPGLPNVSPKSKTFLTSFPVSTDYLWPLPFSHDIYYTARFLTIQHNSVQLFIKSCYMKVLLTDMFIIIFSFTLLTDKHNQAKVLTVLKILCVECNFLPITACCSCFSFSCYFLQVSKMGTSVYHPFLTESPPKHVQLQTQINLLKCKWSGNLSLHQDD